VYFRSILNQKPNSIVKLCYYKKPNIETRMLHGYCKKINQLEQPTLIHHTDNYLTTDNSKNAE